MTSLIGPVIVDVSQVEHQIKKSLVIRLTNFKLSTIGHLAIQEAYKELIQNQQRNELILNDIGTCVRDKKNILVLTDRIEHLEHLKNDIRTLTDHVFIVHGKMAFKEKLAFSKTLKMASDGFVILATGKYIGEGFDDDRLDTLFLTMPFRWRGTSQQYIGRLNRRKTGKEEICVYDYADVQSRFFASMYLERLKGYKQMAFNITSSIDMVSAIYHPSDFQKKLTDDLNKAHDIVFIIKKASQERLDQLVGLCSKKPVIYAGTEMISNMIVIDREFIWCGSINPFVYAHKKDDDIMRYEDSLLANQMIDEATRNDSLIN